MKRYADADRLRAWIDQPLQLLYFESRSVQETDAEAQGTAGGLGVEKVEQEVTPVGWMERWDDRIRDIGNEVSSRLPCCATYHSGFQDSRKRN